MSVSDFETVASEVADLMDEFRLAKCELQSEALRVAFSRKATQPAMPTVIAAGVPVSEVGVELEEVAAVVPAAPTGVPINSPMAGIFYHASGPNSPPFVKEGDTVIAGQVVGLIEAMKVFNEITAPMAGIVDRFSAENGEVVNPGAPLLYLR